MKFSVVVPVKDETHLIPQTLPSYYALNPDEVLICTDKPCPQEVRQLVIEISKACKSEGKTRIIEVNRDPEWKYHQAHVRRSGFHAAIHDRILTGDIDLVLNRNVLKALKLVGKHDVGLASLSKLRRPNSILKFYRLMGQGVLQKYIHYLAEAYRGRGIATTTFTGLYALWRPYWLDSEPEELVKQLQSSKTALRKGEGVKWSPEIFRSTGEDTFLRDCMTKKHRALYLSDIGAYVLTDPLEDRPEVQFKQGIYFALRGRNLVGALARTVFRAQPDYLLGHLYGSKLRGIVPLEDRI